MQETVVRCLKKRLEKWPNSEAGRCDRRICEEYGLARRLSGFGEWNFQTDLGLDECRKRFFRGSWEKLTGVEATQDEVEEGLFGKG